MPSTYQNLSKLVEIRRSSDRNKNAQFFELLLVAPMGIHRDLTAPALLSRCAVYSCSLRDKQVDATAIIGLKETL